VTRHKRTNQMVSINWHRRKPIKITPHGKFVLARSFVVFVAAPAVAIGSSSIAVEAGAGAVPVSYVVYRVARWRAARKARVQRVLRRQQSRTIPQPVKIEVALRDGGRCRQCGTTENLHYDHIYPYALGGSSLDPGNIQLLCGKHNQRKGAKVLR